MGDYLPHAYEAELSLAPEELQTLRDLYKKEGASVTPQTKFNYAWALVRSANKQDQQLGVDLLHAIYRENPGRRRECLYYLALGEYKLGNYQKARRYNDTLVNMEPTNQQALALQGLIGMAIVGGVVAVAGVVGAMFLRRSKD
nr:mitochondrial membrane protein [Polyrhizophydium stewartii]